MPSAVSVNLRIESRSEVWPRWTSSASSTAPIGTRWMMRHPIEPIAFCSVAILPALPTNRTSTGRMMLGLSPFLFSYRVTSASAANSTSTRERAINGNCAVAISARRTTSMGFILHYSQPLGMTASGSYPKRQLPLLTRDGHPNVHAHYAATAGRAWFVDCQTLMDRNSVRPPPSPRT